MKDPTVWEDFSDMLEGFVEGLILWGSVATGILFSLCTLTEVLDALSVHL
jgi:hypothetical protein